MSGISRFKRAAKLLPVLAAMFAIACESGTSSFSVQPVAAQVTEKPPYPPRHQELGLTAEALLGANPPPITDNTRTHVYADLMLHARRFGTPEAPWDEKALIADDGWPVGDFGAFLMTRQAGLAGIPGTYKVSFNGRAKVSAVASKAVIHPAHYDSAANLSTVEVDLPDDANQLVLSFTQTGEGIRNLKVIRPGYDAKNPPLFTRAFLDHVARFQTLRFMDWLRTNNNPVKHWVNRTSPQLSHYASPNGVPWEHIVELANQTGKNIWINIPAAADDDYVLQLARLLHGSLNPQSKIYVEYSNEVWNGQFKQHGTNFDMAEAEVRENPASPLAYDGKKDRATLGYRRIAKRGKEISDIFRSVYGDAAMMTTVRPIYAIQVVNTYTTEIGLKFLDAVYGSPSQYFYAMAGAPYFNLGPQQNVENLTTEQVLQAMENSIERLPEINRFEKNLALARWHGLPFMAYEGGSDTFGPGSIEAKKNANLAPRMESICNRYLNTWYENGGQLFMWFNAGAGNWDTQYGAWELTTDLAIIDTPKIRCVDKSLAEPKPALKGRNTAPGTFSALAFAGNYPPYSEASRKTLRHLHTGSSLDYLVLATQSGSYELVFNAASDKLGNRLDIAVDGKGIHSGVELQANGWEKSVDNLSLPLVLEKGFHTLRITMRSVSTGFDLSTVTIRSTAKP
ncbi:hypothetical protein [Propionivibrio sp.]|uniref:hypothetical protein n=1 Tax=Propionivibrio sp. TaxID=2212460 RepID=UPI003BF36FF8